MPASLGGYRVLILPGFFAESAEHIGQQLQTTWAPAVARLRELDGDTIVAASCYGTFALAESGLLDDLPATTTWWFEKEFRRCYPRVQLDADKTLVDSGRAVTAGAMTAHTDLSLHVLRRLGGAALARSVGGIMLVDGARSSQRPFMALRKDFSDPLLQKAVAWMLDRPGTALVHGRAGGRDARQRPGPSTGASSNPPSCLPSPTCRHCGSSGRKNCWRDPGAGSRTSPPLSATWTPPRSGASSSAPRASPGPVPAALQGCRAIMR